MISSFCDAFRIFQSKKSIMLNQNKLGVKLQKGLVRPKPLSRIEKDSFQEQFEDLVRQQISQSKFSFTKVLTEFAMSRSTFQRTVQKHYACSPQAYLKQQRLLLAKELLEQRKMSVSQVARTVGFNSTSYFNRAFKAQFGKNPSSVNV